MFIAEREGFEPPVPFSTAVFKTAVIDHSTISPYCVRPGQGGSAVRATSDTGAKIGKGERNTKDKRSFSFHFQAASCLREDKDMHFFPAGQAGRAFLVRERGRGWPEMLKFERRTERKQS